jgi:hypothetical protein
MFLTNELAPAELLSEMLTRLRADESITKRFQTLRHDKDLCPAFLDNISAILDVYKSHSTRAYDIQGLQDRGVDILVRLEDDKDIGVQIKSFAEIEQWATGNDKQFIQRLKSQYTDATQSRKVNAYYIVLCTDAIKHARQVRSVGAALGSFSGVKIITPQEAIAFYRTSDSELAGAAALMLCENDMLLEKARSEVQALPDGLAHIILVLLCRAFARQGNNQQLLVSDVELQGWFEDWAKTSAEDADETSFQTVYEELTSRG